MAKKHKYKCPKCECEFEGVKEECKCKKCGCEVSSSKCKCCT